MSEELDHNEESELDLERVITEYGDSLLRMCFLYLKDIHLAEDAVQDTLIKAYLNYGKFRKDSSEKTWIVRIGINVCKNYLRSSWFKKLCWVWDMGQYGRGQEDPFPDDTVISEVMKLPQKYREVILLYYYQQLKTEEISKILNIPGSTVSVRLKRGRERLKPVLKGWYMDESSI